MAALSEQSDRALPQALRETVLRDLRPVRPLLPPVHRTLAVLLAALAAAAAFVAIFGIRPDAPALGPALLWIPAALRVGAGGLLVSLALREGVPGSGPPAAARLAAFAGTPLLLVLLAEWVHSAAGSSVPVALLGAGRGLGCYPREVLVAVPGLVIFGWLLARAYPLKPLFAATIGTTGAGLVADAALHLVCPQSAAPHVLLVHGGAVATVVAAALAFALAHRWARQRRSS